MKSKSIPWTKSLFNSKCPCGAAKKSYQCCWRGEGRWETTPVGVIPVEGSFANDRCYLSPLGGCSPKITKEHFISRNILERITASTLRFENAGHFFGGKDVVEIGIDGFSAKVLCDNHNSSLSDLDTAAGLAFSGIEALYEDFKRASAVANTANTLSVSSGIDMERWMIKVYCGLVAAKKIRGVSGRPTGPDDQQPFLLQALVGINSLPAPLGLYLNTYTSQKVTPKSCSFGTIQLNDGSDGVGGIVVSLGVLSLVLVTSPKYGQGFQEPNWYRHQTLAWNVKQGRTRITYLFTY